MGIRSPELAIGSLAPGTYFLWIDGGNGCCGHEFNWLASVRGRAGIAFNGNRTLLYATGGAGAVHLENANDIFADGSAFDVMFRVVSDPASATPAIDLRTQCVTLQVK